MAEVDTYYPNLTWPQFAMCIDDVTGAFVDMSIRLFSLEFLEKGRKENKCKYLHIMTT